MATAAGIAPFLWNSKGEPVTKAQLERDRKIADALRPGGNYRPEGWWSLLGGLAREGVAAYRDHEADRREKEATDAFNEQWKGLGDGYDEAELMGLATHEFASPQQSAIANALMGRGWEKADREEAYAREDARAAALWERGAEERALDSDYKRAQIDALKAKPGQPLINAGGGSIYDPNTGEWKRDPNAAPAGVDFDSVSGIRKEIHQLPSYKNLAQATPIYQAMAETASRDSRASDLNLVYGLGKIMDPTSVVREGEMFMVQGINTLPDKLVEGINSVLTGESTLSDATREAILTEAYGRMKGYRDAFDSDAAAYRDLADRYKIDEADILPQFQTLEPYQPPPPAPAPGSVPRILDDAGYNALPSGTLFIDPDGQTRRKP